MTAPNSVSIAESPLAGFVRRYGILLVCLTALLLRWWGIGMGLPFVYTSDEGVILNRALRFGSGDLNPHWFNYGSLYMYFIFIAEGLFYLVARLTGLVGSAADFARLFITDPTGFYLVGRAWSGIWGALTVYLVFLLGRRWHGYFVGLAAALLLAVNATAIDNAHWILNDPLLVLLLTAALLACDGIRADGRLRHYALAGICIGLAASMKYIPALMLIAVAVAHLQRVRTAGLAPWRAPYGGRFLAAGGISAAAFLAGTPYALLDWRTFLSYMKEWLVRGTQGRTDIPYQDISGWSSVWADYVPAAMGWGALALALVGLEVVMTRRDGRYLPALVFGAVYTVFICVSKQVIPRYPLVLYPVLSLLAALAVDALAGWFERRRLRLLALAARVGLVLAAAAPPLVAAVLADLELTLPDTRTMARAWADRNLPPESRVVVDPHGPQLAQSRARLEALVARLAAEGHGKAEKYRLQLATLPPVTFAWAWPHHRMYTALPRDQAWTDASVYYQELDGGLDALRRDGVRYVIVSSTERDLYRTAFNRAHFPESARYYDELERCGRRLRRFAPVPFSVRGPRIEVWELP